MEPNTQSIRLRHVIEMLVVAVAYVITGQLGFSLAISPGNVTAVWPPSGVGVAAVLRCGMPALVGVFVGSFALNAWFCAPRSPVGISTALAIAAGSTLQTYLLTTLLRRRMDASNIVSHPRDAFNFIALTAVCCIVAATTGVISLCSSGFVPWSQFCYTWLTWWAGDMGGVCVYTPLIVTLTQLPALLMDKKKLAELVAFLLLLTVSCSAVFGNSYLGQHHYPLLFCLFPFLIWAALRFGISVVTLTIPIVEIFAITGIQHGFGPLSQGTQNESLLLLASFMAVFALIGLTFSCVRTQWQIVRHKLESSAQGLEAKVTERTIELEEANVNLRTARDQAIEASNIKSAFVANISHELRTPISGLLGMNELLLMQDLDSETRSLLTMMYESGNALLSVVNDILDLSKIEAGKVTLECLPFNPVFLVQDCSKLLAPTAASKKLGLDITIDQHMPDFVFGDAARVRQILLNLIGNAVKFTDEGKVSVRIEAGPQDDLTTALLFAVSDTGIGIAQDDQKLLFKPFSQVDSSSTRRFGGTGLGLTISKRFVEMMDGEIGVHSETGEGSTFWFRIPFARKAPNSVPEPATIVPDRVAVKALPKALLGDNRILIVEDSKVLGELAMRQLRLLGAECQRIETGKDAIELAMSGKFDIILMDINLPDISGAEATSAIRAFEKTKGRPAITIIAMTAGAMAGDRELAIQAGMDDYLPKPVNIEQLKVILEKWLARSVKPEKLRNIAGQARKHSGD